MAQHEDGGGPTSPLSLRKHRSHAEPSATSATARLEQRRRALRSAAPASPTSIANGGIHRGQKLLLVTDGYGKILDARSAIADLVGVPADALAGKRLMNYLVRASRPACYAALVRIGRSAEALEISVQLRPRGVGPSAPILLRIAPSVVAGRLVGLHWYLREAQPVGPL